MTMSTQEEAEQGYRSVANRLYYVMDDEEFPWINRYTYAWAVDKNKIGWNSDIGNYLDIDSNKIVWKPNDDPLFGRVSFDWNGNIQTSQDVLHLFRLRLDGNRLFRAGSYSTQMRLQLDKALITPWSKSSGYGGTNKPVIWLRRTTNQIRRGVTLEFHPDDYDRNR